MKSISERLKVLEKIAKSKELEKRNNAPYYEIDVDSIMTDKYDVTVYKNGKQTFLCEKTSTELAEWLKEEKDLPIVFCMRRCIEWCFLNLENRNLFNDDQIERMRTESIQNHKEMKILYSSTTQDERDYIRNLPVYF